MKMQGAGDTAALAAAMIKRRDELRLTQAALAKLAGLSRSAIQDVERETGRHLQVETKDKLEDALGLERGSIDDVLNRRGPFRERGSAPVEGIEQPFDINTASYEQLGQHAEWLSTTSGDPTLGPRWMSAVLEKRYEVENSQDSTNESNKHAM